MYCLGLGLQFIMRFTLILCVLQEKSLNAIPHGDSLTLLETLGLEIGSVCGKGSKHAAARWAVAALRLATYRASQSSSAPVPPTDGVIATHYHSFEPLEDSDSEDSLLEALAATAVHGKKAHKKKPGPPMPRCRLYPSSTAVSCICLQRQLINAWAAVTPVASAKTLAPGSTT